MGSHAHIWTRGMGQGLWALIDVIRKDRPMPASEQCSPTPKLGHNDPLRPPKSSCTLVASTRLLLSQASQERSEKAWEETS